jgi:hypothetical protein
MECWHYIRIQPIPCDTCVVGPRCGTHEWYCSLDSTVDAGNYKVIANGCESYNKVLKSISRFVHRRGWNALAYWFLTLHIAL